MRVEGNLLWDRDRGEEQIDELLALRADGSVGRLRIRGAKIFADGVLENFTGALLEPYEGTDNYGISMLSADELERAVVLLDAHGFQVHVHTIGDRAVRDALDASRRPSAPTAAATPATTSRTSSSSTPTTCRASPSSASSPTSRPCGPAAAATSTS